MEGVCLLVARRPRPQNHTEQLVGGPLLGWSVAVELNGGDLQGQARDLGQLVKRRVVLRCSIKGNVPLFRLGAVSWKVCIPCLTQR